MAYDVTKTNGERLTIVPDRQVDTTTSLRLLGKNYTSYGEIMAENLVQMLEHFAAPVAPANPMYGQLWFKTTENIVYIFTTEGWAPLGGWQTIGGIDTGFETGAIKDTNNIYHKALKIKVANVIVAIVSSDSGTYEPHADTGLQSSFPDIGQGINLNQSGNADVGEEEWGNFKLRGRTVEAEFADMAEIYFADDNLVSGNIVKLGGEREITKTTKEYDDQVFGIVSTAPGFLLNSRRKYDKHAYPVALKGRVPCLVKGTVRKGQRIVASDEPGIGMAVDHFDPVATVGRAISAKDTFDTGIVEVSVGVR